MNSVKISRSVATMVLAGLYTLRPHQPNSRVFLHGTKKSGNRKSLSGVDMVKTTEGNKSKSRKNDIYLLFVWPKLLVNTEESRGL